VGLTVDHLVIGSADLDRGMRWVEDRLGIPPVFGGVHVGFGTRNALLGLGDQYLEVLALDPERGRVSSRVSEQVRTSTSPRLLTVAIARTHLHSPVHMSRVRADGLRLEWELEFTSTPLFFIDWKDSPRPSGLPDGGRISSLSITTPEPATLVGVDGITVQEGDWRVEAAVDGRPLV
jgi:hypothetical protein